MKVNGVTGQSTGAYPVNGSEKNGQKDTVKNTQNNPVKQEGGSVDGSGLNLMQGSIEEKKKQAQKDALELIMNQFSADGKIEQSLDERRAVIAEKKEASAEAQQHIDELNQRQAAAKEDYGITDDSEEQKDLDAYLKVNEYMKSGGKAEEPNEEEWDRFLNMGEMTEYQQIMVDLNKEKEVWQKEVNDNTEIIGEETSAIRSTKQEMLKYHGMVDANKAAQKTMEAASDEIVGMIVQEAKDSIDEEQEEAVEKAEEKQEEKEQQETIREERKAEMEQIQKPIQDLPDLQQAQREIEQSVNEILQQQKLLKEDLKGIKVDTAR